MEIDTRKKGRPKGAKDKAPRERSNETRSRTVEGSQTLSGNEGLDEFDGQDEAQIDVLPWDADLQEWADAENIEDSALKVGLYRVSKSGMRERCWEWTDEIPNAHEVGLRFGGGRYMIHARIMAGARVKSKTQIRFFNLAESYNEESRKYHAAARLEMNGMAAAANPGQEMFGMIKAMMHEFVIPMISLMRNNQAPAPANNGAAEAWSQANGMISQIAGQAARTMIDHTKELSKELATMRNAEPAPAEPADDNEIKEYLKEAIREFGPVVLEAGVLKMKGILGVVKRDEVFQALSQNEKLFARVYGSLLADVGMTEEEKITAEKVLRKLAAGGLGFNLPQRPQAAQTQG